MRCQICLRELKKLRFCTSRIKMCGQCVQSLNEYHEVAQSSYEILLERYRLAIIRNAEADLQSEVESIRSRARWSLGNIEKILAKRLPGWFGKILADPKNTAKEYKILRAYRRGLLHFDDPRTTKHPRNFSEIGKRIKIHDELICLECGKRDVELHAHHIIYKSNFGTDRKQNLITLCRDCHEKEHGRNFDFGETNVPIVAIEDKTKLANNAVEVDKKNAILLESKLKIDAVNYVVGHLSELNCGRLLFGETSGLQNVWEEICVQVQFEESFYWQAYQELVEKSLLDFLEKIGGHERLILWSATSEGWNWIYDHPEQNGSDAPIDEASIVRMLMSMVRDAAYIYENETISEFLQGFCEGDRDFLC